jgi:hypothetical protein
MLDYFISRGIAILTTIPSGWSVKTNATNAPKGYIWIYNNKSIFDKHYRHALLKLEK